MDISIIFILLFALFMFTVDGSTLRQNDSKQESYVSPFLKLFYPLFSWRFDSSANNDQINRIPRNNAWLVETTGNASEISSEAANSTSLLANETFSLQDTFLIIAENGSQTFRIVDGAEDNLDTNSTLLNATTTASANLTLTNPTTTPTNKPRSFRKYPTSSTPSTPVARNLTTVNQEKSTPKSTSTSMEKPPTSKKIITTTPKCEKLSERQKFRRLEKLGKMNQQFMADTPDAAAKHFIPLIQNRDSEDTSMVETMSMKVAGFSANDAIIHDESEEAAIIDPDYCDADCMEMKDRLQTALDARKNMKLRKIMNHGSRTFVLSDDDNTDSSKENCALQEFIPAGNCTSQGTEEYDGYEKLCTACGGVYMLSDNCFPTFINAIKCHNSEDGCIYDRFSSMSHGTCRTRTLSFVAMRNKGTVDCEQWVYEYIEAPIACECFLNAVSFLQAIPNEL